MSLTAIITHPWVTSLCVFLSTPTLTLTVWSEHHLSALALTCWPEISHFTDTISVDPITPTRWAVIRTSLVACQRVVTYRTILRVICGHGSNFELFSLVFQALMHMQWMGLKVIVTGNSKWNNSYYSQNSPLTPGGHFYYREDIHLHRVLPSLQEDTFITWRTSIFTEFSPLQVDTFITWRTSIFTEFSPHSRWTLLLPGGHPSSQSSPLTPGGHFYYREDIHLHRVLPSLREDSDKLQLLNHKCHHFDIHRSGYSHDHMFPAHIAHTNRYILYIGYVVRHEHDSWPAFHTDANNLAGQQPDFLEFSVSI